MVWRSCFLSSRILLFLLALFDIKNRLRNVIHVDKNRFDSTMNAKKKLIKNIFGFYKNHWRILKNMPWRIDKALKYIMACCVLHNYYQLHGMLKLIVRYMKQIW
jgi:hypothetical protein